MKKKMTEFMFALSGTDMEIFEDIITNKFLKFLKFYQIMRDYSEYIKNLEYEFTDKRTLSINISFTKDVSIDDKKDLVKELKTSGYDITKSKINNKKIKMILVKEE